MLSVLVIPLSFIIDKVFKIATIGAVKNAILVAKLTRTPMFFKKRNTNRVVPIKVITNHLLYPANFFIPKSSSDFAFTLPKASKQVRVVENMVEKAANAIKI